MKSLGLYFLASTRKGSFELLISVFWTISGDNSPVRGKLPYEQFEPKLFSSIELFSEAGPDWAGGRLVRRPGKISLRLLPSGPDRVGEQSVRRQPPVLIISGLTRRPKPRKNFW